MTSWRRAAALALGLLASAGAARRADAQGIALIVAPLLADSTTPAPVISVIAAPVPNSVSTVTIELSLDPQFRAPFWARSTQVLQTQFVLDSLLPARTKVYYRARLLDGSGTVRAETTFVHPVRAWLGLVTPSRTTNVLFTRTPTFVWTSPSLTLPPGPWTYHVAIVDVGQNRIDLEQQLSDTSYTPPIPLDACTSYQWSVTARAVNGSPNDAVTVQSPGSFVIQAAECPQVTLVYQNFPNPFGRGTSSASTCFWFDLAHRSPVRLTIYDLRLREVRRIVPGALGTVLDSGAYGRQAIDAEAGCDPRSAWDGRDDAGRFVPPGVYIAVFEADGQRQTKKILYKGP